MKYETAVAELLSLIQSKRTNLRNGSQRLADFRQLLDESAISYRGKFVHIAGSKGKSSTAKMLATILNTHQIENVLFTSPAIHKFTERFMINGTPISERTFAKYVAQVVDINASITDKLSLTLFECLTALFFLVYQEHRQGFGIIETGIGGKLDITNIVTPLVSVITPIELDHCDILGHTITDIATQKAGIIKPKVPVITAAQPPAARAVIRRVADEQGSQLVEVPHYAHAEQVTEHPELRGVTAKIETPNQQYNIHSDGGGLHQVDNACTAITAFEIVRQQARDIALTSDTNETMKMSVSNSIKVVQREPYLVVADGCHTENSAKVLVDTLLDAFPKNRNFILLLASVSGHPYEATVKQLTRLHPTFYLTKIQHHKAIPPAELAKSINAHKVNIVPSVALGLKQISALQDVTQSVVVVCGSNFAVAEATQILSGVTSDFIP